MLREASLIGPDPVCEAIRFGIIERISLLHDKFPPYPHKLNATILLRIIRSEVIHDSFY